MSDSYLRPRCSCGAHASQAEHVAATEDQLVEQAVLRAVVPDAALRRRALAALNSGHELLKDDPFWYATHVAVGMRAAASTVQTRKK